MTKAVLTTFFAADCYKKNLFASIDKKRRIMRQSPSANHIAIGAALAGMALRAVPRSCFHWMFGMPRVRPYRLFPPLFSSLRQSCARFPPRQVDTESAANSDREWQTQPAHHPSRPQKILFAGSERKDGYIAKPLIPLFNAVRDTVEETEKTAGIVW